MTYTTTAAIPAISRTLFVTSRATSVTSHLHHSSLLAMLYPPGGRRQRANVTSQVWWRKPATSSAKMDTAAPRATQYSGSISLSTFLMISMLAGVE
jgi:hypothetical protein